MNTGDRKNPPARKEAAREFDNIHRKSEVMAIFFYSHNGNSCQEPEHQSFEETAEAPITQRRAFRELMERIGAGDTLIVPRLDDLGHSAGEINGTVKLLQEHLVHVVVLQLGEADLTAPENGVACRLLDEMANLEPRRSRQGNKACIRSRSNSELAREAIVTQYSLGESIASLARRYNVPRSRIEKIVCPKRPAEPLLPPGFGD